MHFLLINRFFGTSAPTGRLLEDVAQELIARGHQVTIVASAAGYVRNSPGSKLPAPSSSSSPISAFRRNRSESPPPRPSRFPISAFCFLLSAFQRSPLPSFSLSSVWQLPNGPRLLNWGWFWLASLVRLTFFRYDACLLLTDPPFLPLAARIASLVRRPKRIYWWTMDLYPEALHAAGMFHERGWFYRLLHWLNDIGLNGLTGIICLGDRQLHRVEAYFSHNRNPNLNLNLNPPQPPPPRPSRFPISAFQFLISAFRRRRSSLLAPRSIVVPPWDLRPIERILADQNRVISRFGWQGRKIALYGGNLGEGHLFEEFLAAARHLQAVGDTHWLFAFSAHGSGRPALVRAAAALSNVQVLDYLPETDVPHLLAAATVHLISMKPGWEGIIVPSKLSSVLPTGAPVLFIGPPDADTATEIIRIGCGTCLVPGASGQTVAEALNRLASDVRQQPITPDTTSLSRVALFITAEP